MGNITQRDQSVIAYSLVQLSVKKVMRAVCKGSKDIVITVFPFLCQQQFFRQFIGKHFVCTEPAQVVMMSFCSVHPCVAQIISKIAAFLLDLWSQVGLLCFISHL